MGSGGLGVLGLGWFRASRFKLRFLLPGLKRLGFLGEGFQGCGVSAFRGSGFRGFWGLAVSEQSMSSPCCDEPRSHYPQNPSLYTFPDPVNAYSGGGGGGLVQRLGRGGIPTMTLD